jgi:hypothetical protein
MNSILAKVSAIATVSAATVASIATAKKVHDAEKRITPDPRDDENVRIRSCDLSKATDDVRDLEYVFIDRTK